MDLNILSNPETSEKEKIELFQEIAGLVSDSTYNKLIRKYLSVQELFYLSYQSWLIDSVEDLDEILDEENLKKIFSSFDTNSYLKYTLHLLLEMQKRNMDITFFFEQESNFQGLFYAIKQFGKEEANKLFTPEVLKIISSKDDFAVYNFFHQLNCNQQMIDFFLYTIPDIYIISQALKNTVEINHTRLENILLRCEINTITRCYHLLNVLTQIPFELAKKVIDKNILIIAEYKYLNDYFSTNMHRNLLKYIVEKANKTGLVLPQELMQRVQNV